jgi:hypothetical protein
MPIPTRADCKARFQTGDQPTEADFATYIIDPMYDLAQESIDASTAAVAAAARAPVAFGLVKLRVTTPGGTSNSVADAPVIHRESGCTITVPTPASVGGSNPRTLNHLFTIDLDVANVDAEYVVSVNRAETRLGIQTLVGLTARTAGQITFTIPVLHSNPPATPVECWVAFWIFA